MKQQVLLDEHLHNVFSDALKYLIKKNHLNADDIIGNCEVQLDIITNALALNNPGFAFPMKTIPKICKATNFSLYSVLKIAEEFADL